MLKKSQQAIFNSGLTPGMTALDLSEEQIAKPGRGDLRRAAVGWMIWTSTAGVPQEWIAEKLNLKSAANASQQIRRFANLKTRARPRNIRGWLAGETKYVD